MLLQLLEVHIQHGHGRTLTAQVTSDNSSIAASEYAFVRQKIAGRDLKQLLLEVQEGSKKFALSFWVYNYNAGNYTVELQDNDNTKKMFSTVLLSLLMIGNLKH